MTTRYSSLRELTAQADKIAAVLKAAERGEKIDVLFAEKIEAARKQAEFKVGIVMDDRLVKIEISWATIGSMTETGLAKWILDLMRGARGTAH